MISRPFFSYPGLVDVFAVVRGVSAGEGDRYDGLSLWCPGCALTGVGHILLPFNGDSEKRPVWSWNGDLVSVTISPSIRTWHGPKEAPTYVCHSFLVNGIWQFLGDCTHDLVNQHVPMLPLPDWLVED